MLLFTDMEIVGFIPSFLSEDDPRPASEQIASAYIGGWSKFEGFKLTGGRPASADSVGNLYALEYPGDPPSHELSRATLHNETLVFFEHAWLAIIQMEGEFEVARLD